MAKMTIHRGLVELKTISARIDNAMNGVAFAIPNKASNKKINGKTVAENETLIKSSFESVNALISRRDLIKRAIVLSNAETQVEINGVKMTVADAIDTKSAIHMKKVFASKLLNDYRKAIAKVNTENETLEKNLESFITATLGKEAKTDRASEVESLSKAFRDANTYEMVNPLDLDKVIKALNDEILGFESEVDSVLSESNAVTFIEV